MADVGETGESLDAVLITHEHSDHVSGLLPLLRKFNRDGRKLPVYMSRLTARCFDWGNFVPPLSTFQAGECFSVGTLEVRSFTIPHDAVDPVGFCITANGRRIGVATDLGYMPDSVKVHMRGMDFLLLESNHDVEMLKVGPYPWSVKQRVMGRNGHLSNEVVSQFIANDMDCTLRTLVLGHLSEHNNHPALAHHAAQRALQGRLLSPELFIAEPQMTTCVFHI